MLYSPLIDADPLALALLSRKSGTVYVSVRDGRFAVFSVFNGKKQVVYESSEISQKDVSEFRLQLALWSKKLNFQCYLTFIDRRNQYSVTRVTTRIPFEQSFSRNGRVLISISGLDARRQGHLNKLRDLVLRNRLPVAKGLRSKFPRSSSLRPATETRTLSIPCSIETTNWAGTYSVSNSVKTPTVFQRIWTGVRTPNFARLKKKDRPVNNHTVSIFSIPVDRYVYRWNDTSTGFHFPGDPQWQAERELVSTYYAPPPAPVHNGQAASKALEKLIHEAGVGLEANLAQDLAQYGQTIDLIANTANNIAHSVMDLRHGNIPGAITHLFGNRPPRFNPRKKPKATQAIADNWLALQYGWKPLLNDIDEGMRALANLNIASKFEKEVRASATVSSSKTLFSPSGKNSTFPPSRAFVFSSTVCKFGLRFKVDNHLISFLAQTGFTNPVNLAWEIIPYSFVVDWFIPIGPWLSTLSAWHGLTFLDGFKTQFTRESVNLLVDNDLNDTVGKRLHRERGHFVRDWILLNREKLITFPTQSIPNFKNGLSVTHAENALSLLVSAFR